MLTRFSHYPNKFDRHFLEVADSVSRLSKDSTKVGCVLVQNNRIIAEGYNGFPQGINDNIPERHERPTKYFYTIHAEVNAILNAARAGAGTQGATLYLNYNPDCVCSQCRAKLVQAGVLRIAGPANKTFPSSGAWAEDFSHSRNIANESNMTHLELL